MRIKIRILSLLILLQLFNFSSGNAQETPKKKTILLIFGLSPSQPAYELILDGIKQELNQAYGHSYVLHQEYLNSEEYPPGNFPKEVFDQYNKKYKNIKLDLLISVGRGAVSIIKNYADSYLLSLPAVSMDLDFSSYGYSSDLSLNKQTAVIPLKFDIEKTISEALKLFPKTKSVYFIAGVTKFDSLMLSISREVAGKICADKNVTFLNNISMDRLLMSIRNLPKGSIIFIASFNKDNKLVPYYNPEAVRLISSSTHSPVFTYTDMGFGEGAVGGYLQSYEKAGLVCGETSVRILNGVSQDSIRVDEQDYYENIYDWRELKRWNIAGLIPEGSTILFEEITFWDQYKYFIIAGFLIVILQSLLIINLVRLNRKQKLMTKKIIESENRYIQFLHEDRILKLGQLTSSLSHELNQPLTAILSNAQAGIRFIDSDHSNIELLKQILQKIVENDKRGASILSSIRGMMRLENREKEKVDLNSLIKEVLTVYRGETSREGVHLDVNLPDYPVYVLADGVQIEQVLLNLLFNASQTMMHKNNSKKVINVNGSINNGDVIISVRDKGKGIDEKIKENLFKPFVTSKKDGTGIGLVICRSIIEDHEGKIWAENMPDGGAKFSFSLKMIKDE